MPDNDRYRVHIRFDDRLAEWLRYLAYKERRSVNEMVNEAVRQWLAAKGHNPDEAPPA